MSKPLPAEQTAVVLHQQGGVVDDLLFETVSVPAIEKPTDILVQIKAAALNPIDTKLRSNYGGAVKVLPHRQILGYDAAGIVVGVGAAAGGAFAVGDEVYYAGDITRDGSNQQYQLVDYRLVSHKPKSIDFIRAAAVPLVTLTAWEALHEKLHVQPGKTILITAGAGGVGSIAIQIAKVHGLRVIASASRPETVAYAKEMGADVVINHKSGYKAEFDALKLPLVDYAFNTFDVHALADIIAVTAPKGHVAICVPGSDGDDTTAFADAFLKSITVHWEFMFTRSMFNVEPELQGHILTHMAKLIDDGKVKSTANTILSWKNIRQAHRNQASWTTVGKIVLIIDENQ